MCAAPAAEASTENAIRAAKHERAVTWTQQNLGAYRRAETLPKPPPSATEGFYWHRYVVWRRRAKAATRTTNLLRHGSPAACLAFVDRRFGADAWKARWIIDRESDCKWYAKNPLSSAAGPMQFLDSWGSYAQRTDIVWSINRAYTYVRLTGNWSPWAPTPF